MNRAFWKLLPGIKRQFHLTLDIAAFGHRVTGDEDQNKVGGLERPRNFSRPFLSWQQVFFIQPWLEPIDGPQAVIDLTDLGFILAGMAEENPRHHALSFSGCLVIVCRVSCCTPSIAQVQER